MPLDKEKHSSWIKKRKQHNLKLIRRWKVLKGCSICGYCKDAVALDLDHIDPKTKDRNRFLKGRTAITYTWSKKRIKEELVKCRVLCANCHRIETERQGHNIYNGELV